MMSHSKTVLVLILVLQTCLAIEDFVATEEWQEITEGQRVPAGLHYRMNLETGKKEAKILDPNEKNRGSTAPVALDQNQDDDGEFQRWSTWILG